MLCIDKAQFCFHFYLTFGAALFTQAYAMVQKFDRCSLNGEMRSGLVRRQKREMAAEKTNKNLLKKQTFINITKQVQTVENFPATFLKRAVQFNTQYISMISTGCNGEPRFPDKSVLKIENRRRASLSFKKI